MLEKNGSSSEQQSVGTIGNEVTESPQTVKTEKPQTSVATGMPLEKAQSVNSIALKKEPATAVKEADKINSNETLKDEADDKTDQWFELEKGVGVDSE